MGLDEVDGIVSAVQHSHGVPRQVDSVCVRLGSITSNGSTELMDPLDKMDRRMDNWGV
jgi:hypothetical protein